MGNLVVYFFCSLFRIIRAEGSEVEKASVLAFRPAATTLASSGSQRFTSSIAMIPSVSCLHRRSGSGGTRFSMLLGSMGNRERPIKRRRTSISSVPFSGSVFTLWPVQGPWLAASAFSFCASARVALLAGNHLTPSKIFSRNIRWIADKPNE